MYDSVDKGDRLIIYDFKFNSKKWHLFSYILTVKLSLVINRYLQFPFKFIMTRSLINNIHYLTHLTYAVFGIINVNYFNNLWLTRRYTSDKNWLAWFTWVRYLLFHSFVWYDCFMINFIVSSNLILATGVVMVLQNIFYSFLLFMKI